MLFTSVVVANYGTTGEEAIAIDQRSQVAVFVINCSVCFVRVYVSTYVDVPTNLTR